MEYENETANNYEEWIKVVKEQDKLTNKQKGVTMKLTERWNSDINNRVKRIVNILYNRNIMFDFRNTDRYYAIDIKQDLETLSEQGHHIFLSKNSLDNSDITIESLEELSIYLEADVEF